MAESPVFVPRPDVDIMQDIENVIVHYPPMVHDRHQVHISVQDAIVTISGHTRTGVTHYYLKETISRVPGVRGVLTANFYNDEAVRRDVGAVIPVGVFTNVEHGHVILTGRLPAGTDQDSLRQAVGAVPGVQGVHTRFIAG